MYKSNRAMRIKRALTIDIQEVERFYTITEDGCVFSKIKNRWLKPRQNVYGYIFYSISRGTGMNKPLGAFAHTLVALKYIGRPPSPGHEIDHIDGNKANNHYTNLRWLSHGENIRNSYRMGRRGAWEGRVKPPLGLETRMKMANAKFKPVIYEKDAQKIIYPSIEDASIALKTYRKKIYLYIRDQREFNGGLLSFLPDPV